MRVDEDISGLPDELRAILVAVGSHMDGRRLTPELVESAREAWKAAVPGQEVQITHGDRGGPDAHHYIIQIRGHQYDGATWRFRSGVLERLCRSAVEE
jgi:hypothetical protein